MHPEVVETKRVVEDKNETIRKLKNHMLQKLSHQIENLDPFVPEGADVFSCAARISKGSQEDGLSSPSDIRFSLSHTLDDIDHVLKLNHIEEHQIENLILDCSSVLSKLIPLFTEKEKEDLPSWSKRKISVVQALQKIMVLIKEILEEPLFSQAVVEKAMQDLRQAEENKKRVITRVEGELETDARIMMATIGSSHKLPTLLVDDSDDDDSLVGAMNELTIEDKETIVIFDEAGCIPDYEFLGLSRLGRKIKALVCVGDKEQLPPFSSTSTSRRGSSRTSPAKEEKVLSLLDVSGLKDSGSDESSSGKIRLNTQYRVPRDIAGILNDRIYNGQYQTPSDCRAPERGFQTESGIVRCKYDRSRCRTPSDCRAPERGFHFVHVDFDHHSMKYVNKNEISKCAQIVEQELAIQCDDCSIMVLTPVSSQGLFFLSFHFAVFIAYSVYLSRNSVQETAARVGISLQATRPRGKIPNSHDRSMSGARSRCSSFEPRPTAHALSNQKSLQCRPLSGSEKTLHVGGSPRL